MMEQPIEYTGKYTSLTREELIEEVRARMSKQRFSMSFESNSQH